MKRFAIKMVDDVFKEFSGDYLGQIHPESKEESKNWHYYVTSGKKIVHLRSDKIISITEEEIKK